MPDTHRFSVSAAAVAVREDGKVLALQRRDNRHWEPPGGVVEPGEAILDCLVREVQEETGLIVEPGRLTGVYQNMRRDIVALVFRCTVAGGAEQTSDESVRVRWLAVNEVKSMMAEAYAVRVLDAAADPGPAPLRTHDGERLTRE